MTGITPIEARQMAEAVTPQVAIAKNALGAWCVTLTDAELAMLLDNAATGSSVRLLEVERRAGLYEKLRKLNPREFAELNARNLAGAGAFDDLVSQLP